MDALAYAAFQRSRFGTPVMPHTTILKEVCKAEVRKREIERLTLAGFIWFQEERQPLPAMCDSVRRYYTHQAHKIAVAAHHAHGPVRLDWCTGTMVPAGREGAVSPAPCTCEWSAR